MWFVPVRSLYRVGDVVIRDEFQILQGRFLASAGMRMDYNNYHQLEYQPSFRLLFTPSARPIVVAGVLKGGTLAEPAGPGRSRRMPDNRLAGFPVHIGMVGNPAMLIGSGTEYGFGYRRQSGQRWSMDAALFLSFYDRLRLLDTPAMPKAMFDGGALSLLSTARIFNGATGRSYGGEVWTTWQARPRWRLVPSYSYLDERRWAPSPSTGGIYFWDGIPARFRRPGPAAVTARLFAHGSTGSGGAGPLAEKRGAPVLPGFC